MPLSPDQRRGHERAALSLPSVLLKHRQDVARRVGEAGNRMAPRSVDTPIIGFVALESDHLYTTSDEFVDGFIHVPH